MRNGGSIAQRRQAKTRGLSHMKKYWGKMIVTTKLFSFSSFRYFFCITHYKTQNTKQKAQGQNMAPTFKLHALYLILLHFILLS